MVQLAREALSNVSRHARATTCRVSLYHQGDSAVLEVDDDGRGFDPANAGAGTGQGLHNLRERAERLGGRAEVHSTPGQGTKGPGHHPPLTCPGPGTLVGWTLP